MIDTTLDLISVTQTQDANGIWQPTETPRTVLCSVDSISRREFFDAGRSGLNPEFKFTVFAGDYAGEQIAAYEGRRYSIYRTYQAAGTDYLELYVERQGGTNGTTPEVNTNGAE